jgi:hypothetical protein
MSQPRSSRRATGIDANSGQPKHLLLAGPASLSALVGAPANANGPVTLPLWNGNAYRSEMTFRRLSHETPLLGHERHLVAHIANHFMHFADFGSRARPAETRL